AGPGPAYRKPMRWGTTSLPRGAGCCLPLQQRSFDLGPRAHGHHHPIIPFAHDVLLHQPLIADEETAARKVAVVAQDRARVAYVVLAEIQFHLDGIDDRATARVDDPVLHVALPDAAGLEEALHRRPGVHAEEGGGVLRE